MKHLLIAIAALSVAFAPVALADPDHGKAKEHEKSTYGPVEHTPPGLAKKLYGLPPGQAKKINWRKGQQIPRAYYVEPQYFIARPQVYQLSPPPPGYRWVLVDDDAYLVQTTNGMIANVIANAVANLIR